MEYASTFDRVGSRVQKAAQNRPPDVSLSFTYLLFTMLERSNLKLMMKLQLVMSRAKVAAKVIIIRPFVVPTSEPFLARTMSISADNSTTVRQFLIALRTQRTD
jgi:hypothetical protein